MDVTSSKAVEKEPEFVELVGQISLKSLDKAIKNAEPSSNKAISPQDQMDKEDSGHTNRRAAARRWPARKSTEKAAG